MDRKTARSILREEMSDLFELDYDRLVEMMRAEQPLLRTAQHGAEAYQIEIEIHWDDQENGDVRVLGAIDAGGILPSICPTCYDFIVTAEDERLFPK